MAARSGSILPMRRGRPGHRPVERTLVPAHTPARSEQPGLQHGLESPTGLDMKDRVGGLLRRAA